MTARGPMEKRETEPNPMAVINDDGKRQIKNETLTEKESEWGESREKEKERKRGKESETE